MEENNLIDGADYITLEDAKRLKLPYFEGLAAGFPSPAADYNHESLDLNEKFVHHTEASYFVRVRGESMIQTGGRPHFSPCELYDLNGRPVNDNHKGLVIMRVIMPDGSIQTRKLIR